MDRAGHFAAIDLGASSGRVMLGRWDGVRFELEALAGHRIDTIHIVGGGSHNRLLCQLTADACARPVVAGPTEATALGNVMVQAIAAGQLSGVAEGRAAVAASVTRDTYEPRLTGPWDEALARLRNLARPPGA
jgi:rhamnulokinase